MSRSRLPSWLVVLLLPACASGDPIATGTPPEELASSAQAVETKGDWSLYGDGQCVIGAQTFYKKKFGVALKATGVQSGDVGNCAYLGACMYWVSNAARPDPNVWDRHDWGTIMPQTYDLIIYPPKGSNPYGHVGSVDHMEGGDPGSVGNLYIMDSNWNGNEKKAATIHTASTPYGFYRLKSLASCSPHCEGNAVVGTSCQKNDCGAAQSTCMHDDLGPRCVFNGCPAKGDGTACAPGPARVVSCHDGAVTGSDDCAATGRACSVEGPARCDAPPRGHLDSASCEAITGWAQDMEVPHTPIDVHVYLDSAAGDPAPTALALGAGRARPDLCAAIGSCDHGFALRTPRSLLDGKPHTARAYGIDRSGGPNAELPGGPLTFRCDPPEPPSGALWRRLPTEAVLAAWKFSPFADVAPLPDALDLPATALRQEGPALPLTPRFVLADDGSSDVWLLDSGVRRRVPPEAVSAWHIEAPGSMIAAQLHQLPRGNDLPAAPALVRDLGPTYYLLDAPFLPAGEAAPSPEAPDEAPSSGAPPAAPTSVPVTAASEETVSSCALGPRPAGPAGWIALALALAPLGRLRRRRWVRRAALCAALPLVACKSGTEASNEPDGVAGVGGRGVGGQGAGGRGGQASGGASPSGPGAAQWARLFPGASDRFVVAADADSQGQVTLLGFFDGTIDLGGGPLASTGMWVSTEPQWSMFVARLDAKGEHVWSKRFGGNGVVRPQALAVDAQGNTVLAGGFEGSLTLGDSLTSQGHSDAFVARLDAKGEVVWAHRYGDADDQTFHAVAVDAQGVALAGAFAGSTDLGGGPLVSAGSHDVVLARLDAKGEHVWSKRFGDGASQHPLALALDKSGALHVTGAFAGALDLGGGPLASEGGTDLFVAKLDAKGEHVWSFRAGDGADQLGRALSLDASGQLAVAGEQGGTMDVGLTAGCAGPGYAAHSATGRCYFLSGEPRPFHDAEAACEALGQGWKLAAPSTLEELSWLRAAYGNPHGWIGGNDEAQDGTFVWTSGEPFTYAPAMAPWGPGEPNGGTMENCTELVDAGINDLPCAEARGYLCESTASATGRKSQGGLDGFVVQLDGKGKRLWDVQLGGTDEQRLGALTRDDEGNLVALGSADGEVKVDGEALPAGRVVALSLDKSGQVRWARRYGPGAGQGLAAAGRGSSLFAAGVVSGALDLGKGSLDAGERVGAFLARLTP